MFICVFFPGLLYAIHYSKLYLAASWMCDRCLCLVLLRNVIKDHCFVSAIECVWAIRRYPFYKVSF